MDLKIKVVSFFNDCPLNELVFRRGGAHGAELVEDDLSLKQAQFYNQISLFLEKGIPAQQGEKRLKVFLAKHINEEIPANEETNENALIPDNVFFSFTEMMEVPLRTLVKTSVAK